jgi:uncharacterized protein YutE (UPF0331/DUF86 family)
LRLASSALELLDQLELIRAAGRDAYLGDIRNRLAAQHAIQLAVQICIDIGAHMIAELGVRMPDDYKGIFTALQDSAGLDPDLAASLSAAAKMRNVLVHAYLEVDDKVVWEALENLDDLRRFATVVESFVEEAGSSATRPDAP